MDGFGHPKSSAKARGQDLGRRAGSHGRSGQMMARALGLVALLISCRTEPNRSTPEYLARARLSQTRAAPEAS